MGEKGSTFWGFVAAGKSPNWTKMMNLASSKHAYS